MMKAAVTSKGPDLNSPVDPRFGRASYILIVDTETMTVDVIDNTENANALKGAGIQTAATICESGAEALLTGYCGPNAFKTLKAANIRVVNDVSGTVTDVVNLFKEGRLKYAAQPNKEGHWKKTEDS